MSTQNLTPGDVAAFLQHNPDFFTQHAELFSSLKVPYPHAGQTISLGERQVQSLRERVRGLEWRISELVHNAKINETITQRLTAWCERLVAEADPALLPGVIVLGLAEDFQVEHVALRVWKLDDVSQDVRAFADSLTTPYMGNDTEFEAAAWLDAKPQSLALVALRPETGAESAGLLVLGSEDPARFTPEMGSDFLNTIAGIACAALRRLK